MVVFRVGKKCALFGINSLHVHHIFSDQNVNCIDLRRDELLDNTVFRYLAPVIQTWSQPALNWVWL